MGDLIKDPRRRTSKMERASKLCDLPVYDSRYVGQIWLDTLLLSVIEVSRRTTPWDWENPIWGCRRCRDVS